MNALLLLLYKKNRGAPQTFLLSCNIRRQMQEQQLFFSYTIFSDEVGAIIDYQRICFLFPYWL